MSRAAVVLGVVAAWVGGAACGQVESAGEEDAPVCPDDIRSLAQEVMEDAEGRASLIGGQCGYDGMFFVGTGEGGFRLNVGGYTQFRYLANFRDEPGSSSDFESGFTVARTRLILAGHVPEPRIDFLLLPATGPDGRWFLLDAWARHTFESGWSVKAGQAKLPFLREWLVSERYLLAVERSTVSAAFASVYGQEVETCYTGETLGVHLSFSDGLRSLNSDLGNPRESEYALTARAEIKFQGEWKQFFDMTALNNDQPATMLGMALHNQGRTDNFGGKSIDSLTQYTVDFSHEGVDWSLMGAFVGRYVEVSGEGTRNEFGVLAQAAGFVAERWELFGRYSLLIPDPGVEDDGLFNTITGGVNWYVHGQAAKLTADVVWFLDDLDGTDVLGFGASSGMGLLPSTHPNEVAIRLQFQLIF